MIDTDKRQSMQVLGTGVAAIAGLTATPATANADITQVNETNQKQLRDQGSVQIPGKLFSTDVLLGENEVSSVESDGYGLAVFRGSPDKTRLDYALVAINTTSQIGAAHIHQGGPGENGPVIAHLLGEQADAHQTVVQNNAVAVGTLTADDLVGPCEGKEIATLLAEIKANNAYINVHTANYPDGELRDQLCAVKELDVSFCADIHATSNSVIDVTGSGTLSIDLVKESEEDDENEC
ncbi:CHRD domain-containing protein [Haladaptatus pallidirubidus]|uniref:CHRD domain-containing protein n=1 Tax=Haladaptatus pallidirubidus TaxID=1008152 RepID=A0AAV3UI73_9EURY|nr:CHRD domain-containing protein [Haladaptatus pallidirubidus]